MAGISRKGDNTNPVTEPSYASISKPNPTYCTEYDEDGNCISWGGGGTSYSTASATITGTINSSGNVFVNGQPIAKVGDPVQEWASINVPSGWSGPSSGQGTGTIITGIQGVYSNGRQVANIGKKVQTHKSVQTTIAQGSSGTHSNG